MKRKVSIGIAGNPNSGKTSLFNYLTGSKQRVGNWPGVTVEKREGHYKYKDLDVEVVDLPGIYSLSTSTIDEQVSRDYIINELPAVIVNVVDASNLERNLYLTIQLIEMRVPMILVLNMLDIVKQKKLKIDIPLLERILGIPVIGTVANKGDGIEKLKSLIYNAVEKRPVSNAEIYFPDEVEEGIKRLIPYFDGKEYERYDRRWLAVKAVEGELDPSVMPRSFEFKELLGEIKNDILKRLGEEPDIVIAESRYGYINSLCKHILDKSNIIRQDATDFIDRIVLNRFLGIPIFLTAIYLTFWVTINFGGCFIDFFDIVSGALFVDGVRNMLSFLNFPDFLVYLLADGVGGGIQTVATFIPPIFFIFLCLSILEDSGYMARAAFVMDNFMRFIGLPGKAFVPMLIGFGCNVPAILAARTLENRRDRIITIMMNPLMSCGARMPVYAIFVAAFFPENGGVIVFSLYLIGVIVAVLTGFLLKNTILSGEVSSFIMELPPYHIPTARTVLLHSWNRLKSFVVRAGQVLIIMVVVMNLLGTIKVNKGKDTLLSMIGKAITPVFSPIGIDNDNWPAAVGVITGIMAKESVIGTLETLYMQIEGECSSSFESESDDGSIFHSFKEALEVTADNLKNVTPPFSFAKGKGFKERGDKRATYNALRKYFKTKAAAFAYLLIVLLYIPCAAVIAVIAKELDYRWAVFSVIYLAVIAWLFAVAFYQTATFGMHPDTSFIWLIVVFIAIIGIMTAMKKVSEKVKFD